MNMHLFSVDAGQATAPLVKLALLRVNLRVTVSWRPILLHIPATIPR
jgi:hypothetical protein